MTDILRMDYINSLGQLYLKNGYKDIWWPLHDIDVQTGMLRIDVCGKLDVSHIGEVVRFKDDDGNEYDPDTFYTDYE